MNILTGSFLLFSYLCECFAFCLYCNSFFIKKYTLIKSYISVSLVYLVMFICSLYDLPILNISLYIILNFVLIFLLYKCTWYKAILNTFVLTFSMGITEFLTLLLLQRYTIDYYNEIYIFQNRIIYAIISKTMNIVMIYVIVRCFGTKGNSYEISLHFPIKLFIVPFISLIVFLVIILIWANDYAVLTNLPTNLFIPIITFLILILNIIVFWDEFNRIKRSVDEQNLQLRLQHETDMCKYYQKLLQESEHQALLIHDIKNHLQSLLSLVESNDIQATDRYLKNLLNLPALSQHSHRSDNHLLNAILLRYQTDCLDLNISFDSDIRSNTLNFLTNDEITTLVGNMMDNAIEASQKTQNAFIDLIIEPRMDESFTVIKLRNSYDGDQLKSDQQGILQTKKNNKFNHGFGMKSIKAVVDKYEGDMNYVTDENSHIFTFTVSLKKPKS